MTDRRARELTEIIMAYFKVNYKVAKQYERVLGTKQLKQIKDWHKKGHQNGDEQRVGVLPTPTHFPMNVGIARLNDRHPKMLAIFSAALDFD